ncbi:MAG TPA: Hpt domain-containing protein, partial [Longimicrobiales bacterium]|nr:Hpt domain-containing protein [Longimicrobiales bacterium]
MDEELKRYYRDNLGSRIEALESAVAALPEAAAADAARRVAHTLKGSGGTYGFPEITIAAARAEEAADAELAAALSELVAVLQRAVAGEREPPEAGAGAAPPGGAPVLLVEDDGDIRLLLERRLPGAGCRVIAAPTIAEARRRLRE